VFTINGGVVSWKSSN
jgi:hypothetical protein